MTLWEFSAAAIGWANARGDGKPKPPSDDEHAKLLAKYG